MDQLYLISTLNADHRRICLHGSLGWHVIPRYRGASIAGEIGELLHGVLASVYLAA